MTPVTVKRGGLVLTRSPVGQVTCTLGPPGDPESDTVFVVSETLLPDIIAGCKALVLPVRSKKGAPRRGGRAGASREARVPPDDSDVGLGYAARPRSEIRRVRQGGEHQPWLTQQRALDELEKELGRAMAGANTEARVP